MGKLILVRHGQSIWNLQNRFTGWVDIPLSEKGIKEAYLAGEKLNSYKIDLAFTSKLIRAQDTLYKIIELNKRTNTYRIIHKTSKEKYNHYSKSKEDIGLLEVIQTEKLNERFYGDLQGLNKKETAKKYGDEQVHKWRRSFDISPPNGESLKMTCIRTNPYYKKEIVPLLKEGKTIIIVAHGNSLRAISMEIEKLSSEEVLNFEIGTGIPIIYEFDKFMNFKKKIVL
jgi:2,3-bisphosphoglycerate-dependent phosphoglycerate mutase